MYEFNNPCSSLKIEILVSNNGDSRPMPVLGSMEGVKRANWATSFSVIIGIDE